MFVIQFLLLFAMIGLSQPTYSQSTPKTKRDKNIEWISKQVNTYGHATGLFYIGKGGTHWSCHQIDVKADSVQITANYRWNSGDTISRPPQVLRYADIFFVSTDDKPIPVIELTGKNGKHFTLVLDLLKHPDVKKQLVKAFSELVK